MEPLSVKVAGDARILPERMLGLNSETIFVVPSDHPQMLALAKDLGPGVLRFPGGTASNYFDWREGHISVPPSENPSSYRQLFGMFEEFTREAHPDGRTLEGFLRDDASVLDADVIVVPNLETSLPEEQAAWFEHLASVDVALSRIEMGNEFYLAMLGDPDSAARFPDWRTTADLTTAYLDSMSPHMPDSASVATQCAASHFYALDDPGSGLLHRLWTWDDAIEPEHWFDAVSVHLYPELDTICGEGATAELGNRMDQALPALLARMEHGVRRVVEFIAARLPGREIWVTEWAGMPRSAGPWLHGDATPDAGNTATGAFDEFTGVWFHYVARGLLSLLGHSPITKALYHSLAYSGGVWGTFNVNPSGDGWVPMGPCELLRWFHEAANGGVTYQPVSVEGSSDVPGGGVLAEESYSDVDAAMFSDGDTATLIVHNASAETRPLWMDGLERGVPRHIETTHTPDLAANFDLSTPPRESIAPAARFALPAYSVTRVRW